MDKEEKELFAIAGKTGYNLRKKGLYELTDWLRKEKQIHVEVGSIWDEKINYIESYCYTITAPVNIYYFEPVYASGGGSHKEMLIKGLTEAFLILQKYNEQKRIKISDDEIVIAYLKGYGDKTKTTTPPLYRTNLERYAYLQGRQGDYIEEGLTEDEIVILVKNLGPEEEPLKLEE